MAVRSGSPLVVGARQTGATTTVQAVAADRAVTDYSRWLAERALLRYQFANKPDLDALLVGWFWPLSPLTRDVMQFHYFQRFLPEARG